MRDKRILHKEHNVNKDTTSGNFLVCLSFIYAYYKMNEQLSECFEKVNLHRDYEVGEKSSKDEDESLGCRQQMTPKGTVIRLVIWVKL